MDISLSPNQELIFKLVAYASNSCRVLQKKRDNGTISDEESLLLLEAESIIRKLSENLVDTSHETL